METLMYLIKSASILTIFYLVYVAVLRKDTFFTANRHYLMLGIIAALFLPLLEYTRQVVVEIPATPASEMGENLIMYTSAGGASPTEAVASNGIMINWWYVAGILYVGGLVYMGIRFLNQLSSLIHLFRSNPSEKKNGFTYVKVAMNITPFSFFRYIVYNPELHDEQELEMILKHERVHASQWHSADVLLVNLLLIAQWMNPVAWFYTKRVEENLEYIADNETARQVPSRKEYQLALVKASANSFMPALTNNFYQSFIKKRIVMLNKSTSNNRNAWKLSLVLPLLAVFLWSFNVKDEIIYAEIETPPSNTVEISVGENSFASEEGEGNPADKDEVFVSEYEMNSDSGTYETETNQVITEEIVPAETSETHSEAISENTGSVTQDIEENIEGEYEVVYVTPEALAGQNGSLFSSGSATVNANSIFRNNVQRSSSNRTNTFTYQGNSSVFYEGSNRDRADNEITMVIDKTSTQADLDKVKKIFKDNYDVTVTFSGIERNSEGHITAISIKVKSERSNGNISEAMDDGINPIKITYNTKTGSLSLGNANEWRVAQTVRSGDGNVFFYDSDHKDGKVNVWTSKAHGQSKVKGGTYEIIIDSDDDGEGEVEVIEISPGHTGGRVYSGSGTRVKASSIFIHNDDGDNGIFFHDNDDSDPLIIIDGKESTEKALKKLDSKDIEKIEVIKGDRALAEYGDKAKDGVVKVTTKKN